jgi:Putative DNA-binding domain
MPRDDALPPALRRTQALFYELVTGATGADEARPRATRSEALESVIANDGRLSALERLDIYATMYFVRLRDVLREDYPKLREYLGDDAFDDLALAYLREHAPTRPSARDVGESLPAFVENTRWGPSSTALSELAALERALIEVFDGPDCRLLELQSLRALPPDDLASLPLSLVPSHVVLHLGHDVDRVWRSLDVGTGDTRTISERETTLIVWRKDLVSCFRAVDAIEAAALDLAAGGETFGEVCAWLSEDRSVEEAARMAYDLLGCWVTDALLSAASAPGSSARTPVAAPEGLRSKHRTPVSGG